MSRPKKPKTARKVATEIVKRYVWRIGGSKDTRDDSMSMWENAYLRDAIARALRKAEKGLR